MFINLILKDFIIENKFNVINMLEKVEEANSVGIKNLVIAPAYYDEESKTSINQVKEIIEDLNTYLSEKGEDIKLYPANLIRDNYENIKQFIDEKLGSINDTKYILLNSEEVTDLKELLDIIYEFKLRYYTPIIVAPERIKEINDNYKNINKLKESGCLFQLDLGSLNGEYGKKVLNVAKTLKKKGFYSFLGYEDKFKKQEFNKDLEVISKKGLAILVKNQDVEKNNIKNKKKFKLFVGK